MRRLRLIIATCALALLLSAPAVRATEIPITGSVRPHPTTIGRYQVIWEIPRDTGTRQELVRCPRSAPCELLYRSTTYRSVSEIFHPRAGDTYILSVINGASVTTYELGIIPDDWRQRWAVLPQVSR